MGHLELKSVSFGPDNSIPGFEIGAKDAAAIVFVQEWWGVTNIVKQQAKYFAEHGYRVLVPDLYKGTVGVDFEEAHHLMTSLDYHLALEELRHAVSYLKGTGSPAVGIVGGCMGGALSFAAAQHVPGLASAAPLYGTPAREMPWIDCTQIRIPLQYHTGQADPIRGFSDAASGVALERAMRAAGCDVELFLYPDTPHSFLNAMTPEGVEFLARWGYGVPPPEQVELCLSRLLAFFGRHLKAAGTAAATSPPSQQAGGV